MMEEKRGHEISSKTGHNKSLQNFGVAFALSGVILFTVVSLSVWMTHQSMAEFGYVKLAIAAIIPFAVEIGIEDPVA